MDLIQGYKDEGESDTKQPESMEPAPEPVLKKMHVDVAPSVIVTKQVCIMKMFHFSARLLEYDKKQQGYVKI